MRCPSCGGTKGHRHYLCRDCWFKLPRKAHGPLLRHDQDALARLRELYDQIANGVPPAEIVITIR